MYIYIYIIKRGGNDAKIGQNRIIELVIIELCLYLASKQVDRK